MLAEMDIPEAEKGIMLKQKEGIYIWRGTVKFLSYLLSSQCMVSASDNTDCSTPCKRLGALASLGLDGG